MTTFIAKAVKPRSVPPVPKRPEVEASAAIPAASHVASPDEVRVRAYHKWVFAGKPPGDGVRFWLEAERELRAGGSSAPRQDPRLRERGGANVP
jgi:hypothetical protein